MMSNSQDNSGELQCLQREQQPNLNGRNRVHHAQHKSCGKQASHVPSPPYGRMRKGIRWAPGANGLHVKSVRRYQAPTVSRTDGCQSPIMAGVSKSPPARRLVGIELNPGPKSKAQKRAAKKRAQYQAPAKRKQQKPQMQRKQRRTGGSTSATAVKGPQRGSNRISRSLTVSEEEYIADVTLTSAGFTNLQFAVNPGNAVTFPWLSSIAANFNKYKFLKLLFKYRPITSGFAAAGQSGDIVLSMNPDASDPAPVAQAQVYDLQMRNNGMPCDLFALTKLSLGELNKQDSYYVRVGAAPANTDIKTYDCGNLNLSTIGTAVSGVCGKLFVEYSVLLHSPVLGQPATGGVVHFSGTVPTTGNNFATVVQQPGASPALAGITAANNLITFPAGIPGNYLITMAIRASTSATGITVTPSAGASAFNILASTTLDANDQYNSASNAGAGAVVSEYTFAIANTGGLVTITPSTIVGGIGVDVFIVLLPAAVLSVDETEQLEIDELRARADAQDRKIERLLSLVGEGNGLRLGVRKPASKGELSDEDDFKESQSLSSSKSSSSR
jgi:hypothetical protein